MQPSPSVKAASVRVSLGQAATQASSFVRNLILARLISPADFGIAALLGVSLQVIEMFSNLTGDILLIQAKDGDEEQLQATAQMLRAGRGVLNGVLIFALAWPAARLFGVPEATWAFRCLGLLPVLRGLFHLDMSRLQRHLRFGPAVITDAGANWCATLVAIPMAFWLHSYAAMLWALVTQAATATALSHILAERRYLWAWDRKWWRRIASFGWPLMINGILMFGIFEGDRLIIGSSKRLFPSAPYTLADLGAYSVAFALTMAPMSFVANIGSSIFLPYLARVQDVRVVFRQRYALCCQVVCLLGAVASIGFISLGGNVLVLLYGSKYAAGASVIGWLGAMWAVRIIRAAPTLAAMALGDTKNAMMSNIARASSFLGMGAAAAVGAGLPWIAIAGLCGEVLALCVSLLRIYRKDAVAPSDCVVPLVVAAVGVAISSVAPHGLGVGWVASIGLFLGCSAFVIISTFLMFQDLRARVLSTLLGNSAAAAARA